MDTPSAAPELAICNCLNANAIKGHFAAVNLLGDVVLPILLATTAAPVCQWNLGHIRGLDLRCPIQVCRPVFCR